MFPINKITWRKRHPSLPFIHPYIHLILTIRKFPLTDAISNSSITKHILKKERNNGKKSEKLVIRTFLQTQCRNGATKRELSAEMNRTTCI